MSSRSGSVGGSGTARTRVGRYEIGRTLGEGTFAKVKFARNTETGENVAIKILDKEKILKHKMIGQVPFFICVIILYAVWLKVRIFLLLLVLFYGSLTYPSRVLVPCSCSYLYRGFKVDFLHTSIIILNSGNFVLG